MYLSNLQKKILFETYFNSGKIDFQEIVRFYRGKARKNIKGIITKSLERMMKKELISVVAKKTPHKLFIKEIKLTKLGRHLAKKNLNQGQRLPLIIKK